MSEQSQAWSPSSWTTKEIAQVSRPAPKHRVSRADTAIMGRMSSILMKHISRGRFRVHEYCHDFCIHHLSTGFCQRSQSSLLWSLLQKFVHDGCYLLWTPLTPHNRLNVFVINCPSYRRAMHSSFTLETVRKASMPALRCVSCPHSVRISTLRWRHSSNRKTFVLK